MRLGLFGVRNSALRRLHARARVAVVALDAVEFVHVPRLRERLKPLLVPEEDDVRFYRLCENCRRKATVWGRKKRRQWEKAVVV